MAPKRGGDTLKPKTMGHSHGSAKPEPLSEEEKLRRENKRLFAEVAYLKKLRDFEGARVRLKTQSVVAFKSMHDLEDLLAVAALARSTYSYQRKYLDKSDKHANFKAAIVNSFKESKACYWYRKVRLGLQAQGWTVSKLMKELGLQSEARRRRK